MKILGINSLPNGSPATIMRGILKIAEENIHAEVISFYGNWKDVPPKYRGSLRFGFRFENYISAFFSKYFGIHCYGSILGTCVFLKKVKKFSPDVIHLHNLHLSCINIPILFRYIKKHNIRVIWTLHDCWAFTGRCPHFQMTECDKWKKGCFKCPYPSSYYPSSKIDLTKLLWKKKKKWFTGVKNMTLVTPSQWLSKLVDLSFLSSYSTCVINNGIDLSVFKSTNSDFRKRYNLENKKIILGVAFEWGVKKGLDVFETISELLDDNYKIVLVGTSDLVANKLTQKIIAINKTTDQYELASIYSSADVFVNPTREDTYPTVNMEAIACGTPVITFRTGGSPEIVEDGFSGKIVECNDIDSLIVSIRDICENINVYHQNCLEISSRFDVKKSYIKYLTLYEENK